MKRFALGMLLLTTVAGCNIKFERGELEPRPQEGFTRRVVLASSDQNDEGEPFYQIEENEQLIAKQLLGASESAEFELVSSVPLRVGFKVPFSSSEVDTLAFKVDSQTLRTDMKLSGRLEEIDNEGKTRTYVGSLFGGSFVLQPNENVIRFRVKSLMKQPMEFLIYSAKAD